MNKFAFKGLLFSLFMVAILSVVTFMAYQVQQEKQQEFAEDMLENSELVTSQVIAVLAEADALGGRGCEEENLNALRKLVHKNSEIYDMGYINGIQVSCTANWGTFTPIEIEAKEVSAFKGYRFYSDASNLFELDDKYNITILNNVFTVSLATPYTRKVRQMPDFEFDVTSPRNNHVFIAYSPPNLDGEQFGIDLDTNICSQKYSYCVNTHNPNAGLFFYSGKVILGVTVICGLFCWLLTYSFCAFLQRRNAMEVRFRQALRQQTLYMEYQPIVSVADNQIIAVESLVRWEDKVFGKVSPELFIGIAEKLALYPRLAYFTAQRAIIEMTPVLKQLPYFSVSINIGTFEIQDTRFLPFLKHLVDEQGILPEQLKIEITERIAVPLKELADFSEQARAMGFMVVLDDFGTGVSNLVWLTEIDFDYIKVDRVFVNALNYDLKKDMVSPVMELVTSLQKEVVFEGVETEREYQMIQKHCPTAFIQGWYFYKSMPFYELNKLLNRYG
ncbi:EAL domain-containing protein [Vibrio sp. ABG19]|uniref:EAL domain-containing protein n=1 Tax=Vibrio sp. ABG19 TaxID=2817385 RepID=UPI00249DCB53|nr:EAL domain-containing protein [Vibrio sp. ABG19]